MYINAVVYDMSRGKDSQGEEVIKPYTPTTLDSDVGYFELVIKVDCNYFLDFDLVVLMILELPGFIFT